MSLADIIAAVRAAAPASWLSLFRWNSVKGSWSFAPTPDAEPVTVGKHVMPVIADVFGGWPAATREELTSELAWK